MSDSELIVQSFKAIRHMCDAIKATKSEALCAVVKDDTAIQQIVLDCNEQLMETLGNVMDGMDIIEDSDDWLDDVFDAMHARKKADA